MRRQLHLYVERWPRATLPPDGLTVDEVAVEKVTDTPSSDRDTHPPSACHASHHVAQAKSMVTSATFASSVRRPEPEERQFASTARRRYPYIFMYSHSLHSNAHWFQGPHCTHVRHLLNAAPRRASPRRRAVAPQNSHKPPLTARFLLPTTGQVQAVWRVGDLRARARAAPVPQVRRRVDLRAQAAKECVQAVQGPQAVRAW